MLEGERWRNTWKLHSGTAAEHKPCNSRQVTYPYYLFPFSHTAGLGKVTTFSLFRHLVKSGKYQGGSKGSVTFSPQWQKKKKITTFNKTVRSWLYSLWPILSYSLHLTIFFCTVSWRPRKETKRCCKPHGWSLKAIQNDNNNNNNRECLLSTCYVSSNLLRSLVEGSGVVWPKGGHLAMPGDSNCPNWGSEEPREVILASGGWRSGLLLNPLHCVGLPSRDRIIQLKIPRGPRLITVDKLLQVNYLIPHSKQSSESLVSVVQIRKLRHGRVRSLFPATQLVGRRARAQPQPVWPWRTSPRYCVLVGKQRMMLEELWIVWPPHGALRPWGPRVHRWRSLQT